MKDTERQRIPMDLSVSSSGGILSMRREITGSNLSADERKQLLAEVRGNPATTERLTVRAVVFLQGAEPNRNFVRFQEGALKALAESFKGRPFLRDHKQGYLDARAGTVRKSELVTRDGKLAIEQELEIVKPWAIEGVLDGTIDRFSIGWHASQLPTCSVCSTSYKRSGIFGWMFVACEHSPGDVVEVNGKKVTAEILYGPGCEGIEVSAVSVPAVVGTEIVAEERARLASVPRTTPPPALASTPPAPRPAPAAPKEILTDRQIRLAVQLGAPLDKVRAEKQRQLDAAARAPKTPEEVTLSEGEKKAARQLGLREADMLETKRRQLFGVSNDPRLTAEENAICRKLGISADRFLASQRPEHWKDPRVAQLRRCAVALGLPPDMTAEGIRAAIPALLNATASETRRTTLRQIAEEVRISPHLAADRAEAMKPERTNESKPIVVGPPSPSGLFTRGRIL